MEKGGMREREKEKAGLTRFYSGSDEARKRNKEKMYTRETGEAARAQTRTRDREMAAKRA